MEALRILALTSWYPSATAPFLGNFVKRHCEAISVRHKVWLVHVASVDRKEDERIERSQKENLRETIIYQKPVRSSMGNYRQKLKAVLSETVNLNVEFDLVHAHVLFPLAPLYAHVAKKLEIPWVYTEHWSGFHPAFRPRINPVKWHWVISSAKSATMGFPVSQNLAGSVKKVLPNQDLRCVPNVVEDVFFNVRRRRLGDDKPQFLHVSTLMEQYKNIRGMLEAFAKVKISGSDFLLTIVSDGDPVEAKKWAGELDLSKCVDFIGPSSPIEIADRMSNSDAFVLFSNTENQPCVVLEALAVGLPVIGSAVGDLPNLVTEDSGYIVPPKDVEKLVVTIQKFIENRSKFNSELVSNGAREKFSSKAVSEEYSKAYHQILD